MPLILLQEQPPPTEIRVQVPSIDLSGIGQAIVNAVQAAMPQCPGREDDMWPSASA